MRILVLCTGNRCRSQMAHGILQQLYPDAKICSAGLKAASEVHPIAVKVMAEIGIDISCHYPKNVSEYSDQSWDYVITVCGDADKNCPTFAGKAGIRLHIGFDDPDSFTGPESEVLHEFRRVRDEIRSSMTEIHFKAK